ETDKDHIHLMIQYIPRVSISSIVNRLKSITTYHLWKKYKPFLKKLVIIISEPPRHK
ncbi:MAG: transposase, partial [Sulfurimonadaceae bacterium]|nr:transposase [Sulfurimonadaceae bacterium]